mgnify:CR=1 FL=1
MYRFLSTTKQKLGAALCMLLIVSALVAAPINQRGEVQEVYAIPTTEVGPLLGISKANTVFNSISQALQDLFYVKEFSLDPIAYALAKMILKSMTQSILNWINSGFQGSPAFVTDLKQFLLDQADQIVGDFIYNDPSLNFLCSPFQLDVKIALATSYQEQAYEGFASQAQCTLSGVTDNVEGFLAGDSFNPESWFEITQNPINTPTGAYLAAEGEMMARIIDAEGNTINELEWGQGFLSFKVCSDTDAASGAQTNCSITTPGQVIADQVNASLGAGQDALIEADEINEIIGALFAQLAQMAITGLNGLLGLSGGGFAGPGGTEYDSYLDALGEEGTEAGTIENPLEAAVRREEEHIELQNEVVGEVNNIEAYLENAQAQYGSCMNISMPNNLVDERDQAITSIIQSEQVLPVLQQLRDIFASSTDPQEQLDVIDTYNQLQSAGLVVEISENNLLEIYIDFELSEDISAFKQRIDQRVRQCENR